MWLEGVEGSFIQPPTHPFYFLDYTKYKVLRLTKKIDLKILMNLHVLRHDSKKLIFGMSSVCVCLWTP